MKTPYVQTYCKKKTSSQVHTVVRRTWRFMKIFFDLSVNGYLDGGKNMLPITSFLFILSGHGVITSLLADDESTKQKSVKTAHILVNRHEHHAKVCLRLLVSWKQLEWKDWRLLLIFVFFSTLLGDVLLASSVESHLGFDLHT